MGDFTNEILFSMDMIKQEPFSIDSQSIEAQLASTFSSMSASVPIPGRKEIKYELSERNDNEMKEEFNTLDEDMVNASESLTTMWNSRNLIIDLDSQTSNGSMSFRIDDDDIFQVDKADLIQGPTLAELNANDDTLLQDLNFDDLLLPGDNSFYKSASLIPSNVKFNSTTTPLVHLTQLNSTTNSSLFMPSSLPSQQNDYSTLISQNIEQSTSVPSYLYQKLPDLSPNSHNSSDSFLQYSNTSSPPPNQLLVSPPLQNSTFGGSNELNSFSSRNLPSQTRYGTTLHNLLLKRDNLMQQKTLTELTSRNQNINGVNSATVPTRSVPSPSRTMSPSWKPSRSPLPQSGGGAVRVTRGYSRLSSSAPTHLGLQEIWQRREPRQHLLSTGSLVEAGSTSSLSTGGVLSPEALDFSHDEGFNSEDDSNDSDTNNNYEDYSTDSDSEDDRPRKLNRNTKKERYFWQYNVQSKGPKGQRLVFKTQQEDPHVLNEVTDPVFSPDCSLRGIKHSGKARKGDGNDLTPNAKKLNSIGKELDKLNKVINDMTPVSELPMTVRPKTRKEKNKLASRACRLKKKAQHEANKIKLYGLEAEHKRVNNGLQQVKEILKTKFVERNPETQVEYTKQIEKIIKSLSKIRIAGSSTEYVNKVLERIKSGVPDGGLDDFS